MWAPRKGQPQELPLPTRRIGPRLRGDDTRRELIIRKRYDRSFPLGKIVTFARLENPSVIEPCGVS